MTKEEAELIIKEQDKSTKEILKAIEEEKCELLGIIQGKDTVIYKLEKENAELKAQVEKMKQELDTAREEANRQEQWELYSVLNDIYNDNFEVITSVSN